MSPRRTLYAADFRKQPRGPYLFDRWAAVPALDTPLGRFKVELNIEPDAELVATANALADFLAEHADAVVAAVYDNYLSGCYNEGWMESCQVPTGLAAAQVVRYLNNPTISVRRARDGGTSGVIYFSPQWEEEHGLYLKVSGGRVLQTDP
jgi:hypothetical protein